MSLFQDRLAPVYDDKERSVDVVRRLLVELVGERADSGELAAPVLPTPTLFVDWLQRKHDATPLLATMDLHDKNVQDLNDFEIPGVGTDRGELTGWVVAERVVLPRMLSGQIPYKIPILFLSGEQSSLEKAKSAAVSSPIARQAQSVGITLDFLGKPQRDKDADATALWRRMFSIAKAQIFESGFFDSPLFELGLDSNEFNHLNAIGGLQKAWGLSEIEMARILLFRDPSKFVDFRDGNIVSLTDHWRRHVELLYALKTRLSGLSALDSWNDRLAFEHSWLRVRRDALAMRSPLDILLTGRTDLLETLVASVEGIEFEPSIWMGVPIVAPDIQKLS